MGERDFKRWVFIQEEAAQEAKRFLTGRQVAWMIYEYFKVSDTDESVLDLDEILKVELKNNNVQSFTVRWDVTLIAMKKEILDNLYYRQLQQSEQPEPFLPLYIQDTVPKGTEKYEQKNREKHFSSRDRQLEKPFLALVQPKASLRTKEKETVEIAHNGQQKVNALEETSVERGILWKEELRQGGVLSGKENQRTCFAF